MDDPAQADASSGSDGSWYWGTSMSITQPLQGRRENARYQGSSSSDRRAMYSSIPGVHLLGWILAETGCAMTAPLEMGCLRCASVFVLFE